MKSIRHDSCPLRTPTATITLILRAPPRFQSKDLTDSFYDPQDYPIEIVVIIPILLDEETVIQRVEISCSSSQRDAELSSHSD